MEYKSNKEEDGIKLGGKGYLWGQARNQRAFTSTIPAETLKLWTRPRLGRGSLTEISASPYFVASYASSVHLERRSREVKGGEHPFSSLSWKHVGESIAFLDEEYRAASRGIFRSIWLNFFEIKRKFGREKNCEIARMWRWSEKAFKGIDIWIIFYGNWSSRVMFRRRFSFPHIRRGESIIASV